MNLGLVWAVLAGVFAIGLGGCAVSPPRPEPAAGLANPASVYCEQKGGLLISRQGQQGSDAMCRLPDGTEIEEWALFRQDHLRPAS